MESVDVSGPNVDVASPTEHRLPLNLPVPFVDTPAKNDRQDGYSSTSMASLVAYIWRNAEYLVGNYYYFSFAFSVKQQMKLTVAGAKIQIIK